MIPSNPSTLTSLSIVSATAAILWYLGKYAVTLFTYVFIKPVQYFTRLEVLLKGMSTDISEIKTNHLPHIYDRMARIEERFETREDQTSHE